MDGGSEPYVMSRRTHEARMAACGIWKIGIAALDGADEGEFPFVGEARDSLAWLYEHYPQYAGPPGAHDAERVARHYSRCASNFYYDRWRQLVLLLRITTRDR